MGQIVEVAPPDNTAVVSLASFKAEIGETGSSNDAVLQSILDAAQSMVVDRIGHPIARAQYRETIRGSDRQNLRVQMRPIVTLDAISYQESAQTLSEFEIDSGSAGLLFRNTGTFGDTRDPNAWSITSTSGWFLSGDDKTNIQTDAVALDKSYNSSALFPTHLKPGDRFIVSGYATAANNGPRVVVTATPSKITVTNTLVDEAVGANSMTFSNVPGAIIRAITVFAKEDFFNRTSATGGGELIEESIAGGTTLRYSSASSASANKSIDQTVAAILAPYLDF